MIVDLNDEPVGGVSPDICIIGAGAAGISLAVECSRHGLNALILEGGGRISEDQSQSIYNSEIVGLPHQGVHTGRFRVLGGTTTRWGGQILELDEIDFQHRPWIPNSGWPIAKRELRAGLERAIEIEGLSRSLLRDADVWNALRTDAPQCGDGIEPFFTRFCPEPDFQKLYRSFLQDRNGPTIYIHANFTKFVLGESGDRVGGVECRNMNGAKCVFFARFYVICTGAIETARLLLQPLNAGRTAPWNLSDHTGRFFQDHLEVPVAMLAPFDNRQFHRWFDNAYLSGIRYIPKVRLSAYLQERFRVLNIGASFHPQSRRQYAVESFREALLEVRRGGVRRVRRLVSELGNLDLIARKGWRMVRHRRAYNPDDLGIEVRALCEQAPNPASRITLSSERDRLGLFRTRLDWRIGQPEFETVGKFTRHLVAQLDRMQIARAATYNGTLDDFDEFTRSANDSFHHMGTARMASSAADGVVDPNLKLFGVDNAFVCGSAVFPTSGFSNPTHTIVALAVRLAEHLSKLK